MNHFIINILWTILGCSILILIYAIYYFYRSLKPPRFITPVTPEHYGLIYEKISFKTEDDVLMRGWFIPGINTDRAMIICHGYPFDKGNLLPLAKFLYPDFNLLLFDFRAMGESEGKITTVGYLEPLDLKAALNELEKRGFKKIGVLGYSLGASVALLTASDPRIKAIVADSPFASLNPLLDEMFQNLGPLRSLFKKILIYLGKTFLKINLNDISPEKIVRQVQTPIFLIHGDEDTQIKLDHAIQLKNVNPSIQLWIVSGADHGQAHELYSEEYEEKVRTFLNSFL